MISLGIISGLLNLAGTAAYVAEIFQKKSSPERATWFIWSLLGVIAFFAQKAIGASDSLWFVGLQTIGVSTVFLLSIRYGMGGLNKRDIYLTLLAIATIFLWIKTDNPLLSLVTVVIIRSVGITATIIKTYETPKSEAVIPWLLYACGAVVAIASVGELNFGLLLYPAYVLAADSSVMIAKYYKSLGA